MLSQRNYVNEFGLNNSQQNILNSFIEISNVSDPALCIQILEENRWNLDSALSQFYHGGNTITTRNRNNRANRIDSSVNGNISRTVPERNSVFDTTFSALKWLFQSRPRSLHPDQDAIKFLEEYDDTYGENHPAFQKTSYQTAVANAFVNSKFLLVYLHSPIHEDTGKFCRQVLSSSSIVSYANENVISWAGSIFNPEAYALSSQLHASAFPFIAVLICESNRVVKIAASIQGYVDQPELLNRLRAATETYGVILTQNRLETQRREEANRLRESQDREYNESLEQDRREELRRQEEEKQREAAEQAKQEATLLQEAMELSKRLTHEDKIRKIRDYFSLHPEPDPNTSSSKDPSVVTEIRFQLPSGKKVSRRFLKSDPIQILYDYLTVYFFDNAMDIKNFMICKNFPKVELTNMLMTLDELGLYPRGALYVQDLNA